MVHCNQINDFQSLERRNDMTNTQMLNDKIADSGRAKAFIARKLGITTQALYNKISNRNEFKVNEVIELCKILDIKSIAEREQIFFAK